MDAFKEGRELRKLYGLKEGRPSKETTAKALVLSRDDIAKEVGYGESQAVTHFSLVSSSVNSVSLTGGRGFFSDKRDLIKALVFP